MEPINEKLKNQRILLNLSTNDIADNCKFTIHEYSDIESYIDEIITVVHIKDIRCLCKLLKLNIFFELGYMNNKEQDVSKPLNNNRCELVKEKRLKLNMNNDKLGDLIGFEIYIIDQLEADSNFIESWSLELVNNLANELNMKINDLI